MSFRKRATIIVQMPEGILLVSHSRKPNFMLPGGGVRKRESSMSAAIRELYEETGLHTKSIRYLFTFNSLFRKHEVFFAEKVEGRLRTRKEIKHLTFWNEKTRNTLKISGHVEPIIEQFNAMNVA